MRPWAAVLAALAGAGGIAACVASAPPEVLQRDTAEVLRAKAKAVTNPNATTIAAALEAKGQLVHDLCCYEGPDGGADASPD